MSHPVDAVLAQARCGADVEIPAGWGQGRATFGGLVGGVLVANALAAVDADEVTVRAVTVNFVAPVDAGRACVVTEVLRQGKSATQLETRIMQPDASGESTVRAVALTTLGAERESALELAPSAPDFELPAAEDVESLGFVEGLMPDFIAHLDMRLARGKGPYSGSVDGDMAGYMRFRELPEEFSLAHLVTLIDAWPPAPLQLISTMSMASSMTWTMEILAPHNGSPETLWRYDVTTDAAHHGYGHTQARIYDSGGRCIAISRQTVAVFG